VGAVLSLRDVRHRRGRRDVLKLDALDVEAGGRLAVLGPNGAGKTTLLRLLAGIEPPTEGTVLVDGASPAAGGVELRRRVAYAAQRPGLLSTSVRKNVELPLRWRKVPRAERHERAAAALARLGVAHLAERRAGALSEGEAQRVSLARALATEPALLLLDEPAAALDAEARAAFLADVERALAGRAITVVHVSHRAEEALRLADIVAVLVEGELRQLAAPADLTSAPADATVARLVGYENLFDGLAVWAAGVRLGPPGDGMTATVLRVTPGPGRWEVALDGPTPLRAHLPLSDAPPAPGERVGITLDPSLTARVR
jgi:ABC-type Fe3+/spermidine/putrescine transport system ATPase subunit